MAVVIEYGPETLAFSASGSPSNNITAKPAGANGLVVDLTADDTQDWNISTFTVGGQTASTVLTGIKHGVQHVKRFIFNPAKIAAMSGVAISYGDGAEFINPQSITHTWISGWDGNAPVSSTAVGSTTSVVPTTSGNTVDDLVLVSLSMYSASQTFTDFDTLTGAQASGSNYQAGIAYGFTTDTTHTITNSGSGDTAAIVSLFVAEAESVPTISNVDDDTLNHGQTGIEVTGTNFEATQAGGTVKISPTDDVDDADAVTQTVTSWSNTSIDFTAVRDSDLPAGDSLFLFVTNDSGDSNASGYSVSFNPPVIDSVDDTTLDDGQTDIVITGSGFGATQGAGFVRISDTDTIGTGILQGQTVTAWSDTEITFTASRGSLPHTDSLFLFVQINGGQSNVAGASVAFNSIAPSYTTTPSVTAIDQTTYTITAETDKACDLVIVALLRGSTAPTATEVANETGAGGATPVATATKSFAANTLDTIEVEITDPFPIYDLYGVATNDDGLATLVPMTAELLSPPANKNFVVLALKEITAVAKSNPVRITAVGHGIPTGQESRVWDVVGATELNDGGNFELNPPNGRNYYHATSIDSDTVDLDSVNGTLFSTYVSGGIITPGFSFLEGASPVPVDGDVAVVDSTVSPSGITLTFRPDGTITWAAAGSTARQSFVFDVYDVSLAQMHGEATQWVNNIKPSLIDDGIPAQDWTPGVLITPVLIESYVEDFDGDVLTATLISGPTGISVINNVMSGTPSVEESGTIQIRVFDITGDYTDVFVDFNVEDLSESETEPEVEIVTVLPVRRPQTRSIDAKTIADYYNRSQPKEPDYEFQNGRKFYQE